MAKLERSYNVPLRSGFVNTPKYKRAKKATTTLREFLVRHMKSDNIKLGQHLNQHLWKHGMKNPPHHVKIKAVKEDDGTVKAELEGFDFKGTVKAEEKVEEKGLASKLVDKIGAGKKPEAEEGKEGTTEVKEKDKKETETKPAAKKKSKPTTEKAEIKKEDKKTAADADKKK